MKSRLVPVVFLSIQKRHYDRILARSKRFELRKNAFPSIARLAVAYVPDEQAILGVLRLGSRFTSTTEKLWETVRDGGIAREDFARYFGNRVRGSAAEILSVEELGSPIRLSRLKELRPGFQPPLGITRLPHSSAILREVALHSSLVRAELASDSNTKLSSWDDVGFRPLNSSEVDEFERLSTEVIGENYNQIDESFASAIVEADREGFDARGHLTKGKKIRVILIRGRKAGFVVTTQKLGGSIKFGPFILLPEFRRQGYGPTVRRKLDDRLRESGVRKTYSTVPDNHYALKYLLKSGYAVEAHLRYQYSPNHGDLVLGRVLSEVAKPPEPPVPARDEISNAEITQNLNPTEFRSYVMSEIGKYFDGITPAFVEQLLNARERFDPLHPEGKGKRIFTIQDNEKHVHGAVVCSVKRGGAVKLSPFLLNAPIHIGEKLLKTAEREMTFAGITRKFYSHIPISDSALISMLECSGYSPEGVLHEPYRPGVHMMVLAKVLSDRRGP